LISQKFYSFRASIPSSAAHYVTLKRKYAAHLCETVTTANTWGTSNSKPPALIIMTGLSRSDGSLASEGSTYKLIVGCIQKKCFLFVFGG
jgi:hypothetical protein